MVAMDTETWNGSRSPILHKKRVLSQNCLVAVPLYHKPWTII